MFREAETLAKTVDKEKQEADKFHDTEHTLDALQDKGNLMMQMLDALRNHYESMGLSPTGLQAAVSNDWNRLNAGNPRLEVIAQRFKQEFQRLATQQAAPQTMMQKLQALMAGIAMNPRMLDDRQTQKRLNQFASLGPEYAAIVDRAEAQFAKPQPTKAAARPLAQAIGKAPQNPKQESFRAWIWRNWRMM